MTGQVLTMPPDVTPSAPLAPIVKTCMVCGSWGGPLVCLLREPGEPEWWICALGPACQDRAGLAPL